MIRFSFDVDPSELEPPSPGFALGDMEVMGGGGRATSRGHTPDQSMMIFVALSDLLDGLRTLAVRGSGSFHFVGTDSSFRLDFTLGKGDRITTRDGSRLVDAASPATEVLEAAYRSARPFFERHQGLAEVLGCCGGCGSPIGFR
ncbi:hypothetical protein [Streptomyces sp. NPDC059009]|uniref:hypothetical protein n=1 Tax=Streptomyces sp. NPDC059009 TaxID=3346694 RepID=UPI0036AB12AB